MFGTDFLGILWSHLIGTFTGDAARYIFGAGGTYLIINVCLARWLVRRRIQPHAPKPGQILRELFASARTVCIFTLFGTGIGLMLSLIHI